MPRFVVLRHEMLGSDRGGVHWDLMLERDGALRTWALAEEPTADREIAADQLAEHRLAYLDYEGPISGDRGSVTRIDAGDYEDLADSAQELTVRLRGGRLIGDARLHRQANESQRWTFFFSTAASGSDSRSFG
jgi:hypothetical protein